MADPNERAERKPEPSASKGRTASGDADKESSGAPASAEQIKDRNKRIREEAAARRRAKREIETRRVAPARNLDTSEIVDDALARTTHAASNWLKKNFAIVQWAVLLVAVGGIGYQIYTYRHNVEAARVTDELNRAIRDEHARVGSPGDTAPDPMTGLEDTRATFPDDAARLKAAAESYRKVEATGSSATSAIATLGLAGVLYDQGKFAEAKAQYEKAKNSSLAAKDSDARARALEGIGLSAEAMGNTDAALSAFRELANSDNVVFAAQGEYQQARLLVKTDKRDAAKDLLKKALKRLAEHGDKEKKTPPPGGMLLDRQARELLRTLDPSAPELNEGTGPDLEQLKQQLKLGSDGKIDPKQLDALIKQLRQKAPAAPASSGSGAPAPAPAGSAP